MGQPVRGFDFIHGARDDNFGVNAEPHVATDGVGSKGEGEGIRRMCFLQP
jgi:hypothetical protein